VFLAALVNTFLALAVRASSSGLGLRRCTRRVRYAYANLP